MLATDGVYDNLYEREILDVVDSGHKKGVEPGVGHQLYLLFTFKFDITRGCVFHSLPEILVLLIADGSNVACEASSSSWAKYRR